MLKQFNLVLGLGEKREREEVNRRAVIWCIQRAGGRQGKQRKFGKRTPAMRKTVSQRRLRRLALLLIQLVAAGRALDSDVMLHGGAR
ncbi:hypothetical protein ANANG_G00313390 [Anguilla anguilla]|uniref:Uncharacterized protein n=1 Tax=Anguilla anguilla TaxID=7936 RepID=A0A9D3RHY3_ANGAN|nr:hypothetical protein ANANG_G00313390 [Anguilla anguilla]